MVEEKLYTLRDSRDEKSYKIVKAKDGQVWFGENLKLENYLCTSEDSDMVGGSFQVPASNLENFTSTFNAARVYVDEANGGYYNYFTATAGESTNESEAEATRSILPKGWKLPRSTEYSQLVNAYGGNNATGSQNLRSAPMNFLFNGEANNKALLYVGDAGNYFGSITEPNRYNMFVWGLRLTETIAASVWGHDKQIGRGVRGILRPRE